MFYKFPDDSDRIIKVQFCSTSIIQAPEQEIWPLRWCSYNVYAWQLALAVAIFHGGYCPLFIHALRYSYLYHLALQMLIVSPQEY